MVGREDYSLLVTMSGFDDTYQAEVRAHKYWPKDIYPNFQFDDAIIMINGKPMTTGKPSYASMVKNDRPINFIARSDEVFTDKQPPVVTPKSTVHLFGLGDEVVINKEIHLVGSGCIFSLLWKCFIGDPGALYTAHTPVT